LGNVSLPIPASQLIVLKFLTALLRLEQNLAIIAANIPPIRPLFSRILSTIRSDDTRSTENPIGILIVAPPLQEQGVAARRSTLESSAESEDTILQDMKRDWLNRNSSIGGVKEFIGIYGQKSKAETGAERRLS